MANDGSTYPVREVLIVVAIMMALSVVDARLAYASTTFTVNSTGDAADANLTNAACDVDAINFNIPRSGMQTISPSPELPIITAPVTINGYTQGDGTPDDAKPNTLAVGDNAVLKIKLDGARAQDRSR